MHALEGLSLLTMLLLLVVLLFWVPEGIGICWSPEDMVGVGSGSGLESCVGDLQGEIMGQLDFYEFQEGRSWERRE